MAAFPISVQNPSPVFGLPVNLCKRFCPQYGHRIIFSRKCYYEAQCPLPSLAQKFSRSTDGENHATVGVPPEIEGPRCEGKIAPVQGQRVKKQPNSPGLTRLHPGRGTDNISEEKEGRRALLWPSSVGTIQHGEKAENKDRAQQMGSTFGCDTPTAPRSSLLGVPFLHRLSSTNFFKRFLAWAWNKSAYNDPAEQRTNFGWIKKQEDCQHEKISIITGKCQVCGYREEVPYHQRHDRGSQ